MNSASQTTPALRLRGLSKTFGQTAAVENLDLDVPRGSFYGFVGPNGAGKTTTLSMATGLMRPDAGTAEVVGIDVWEQPREAKRSMGVLADGVTLFNKLTGAQLVAYAGLLRGMDRDTVESRTADLLRVLGLQDAQGKLVQDYSAGMTKKIALASAMVHAPELLVLDEPFEAVDPVSARTIRGLLESYVSSGGTVILSSHVMDLVQRMCSHVGIIAEGCLLASGTLDEVRAGSDLETRFVELVGLEGGDQELAWLQL
ncbi:ABC transporter ATP-binding protein [Nesterenkonia sandarakina]|uniref:ABC-2 type transport system ATP-binding protein n=1 Tax=Nesterenkonia sandarakina TaxID=272918 RepID=A0A7Z0J4C8_9MICC|nr:ABC transporter ATP-binding protein [Nesterenkonia sandarakina]NYJ17931.1 ABC-2 type transport system ATP-binding protein [Nesterenkonia sandarakina]